MASELKVTIDTGELQSMIDETVRKFKAEMTAVAHPIHIETDRAENADGFVSTQNTRVTVGGMAANGVRSIKIIAEPNDVWIAEVQFHIDPNAIFVQRPE